jgi:dolichol-phosphate mannosyltransferase
MSGFFAFRRKKLLSILTSVDPLGFKILFDMLLLSGHQIRISEISYRFRNRHAGESKLDWRVQWDFLIQTIYHLMKQVVPHDLISFILVGASGATVQFATLWLGIAVGLRGTQALPAAIGIAMIWNFVLNHYLTFHRHLKINADLAIKFLLYASAVTVGIVINISAANFSMQKLYRGELLASILGICADTIWRFSIAKALIWRR